MISDQSKNDEQIAFWNGPRGEEWVKEQEAMDRALEPFGRAALERAEPRAGEHAIDVGCGCGATTLALAAAVGPSGGVVGVDVSAPMLARARERARGLAHVTFVEGDAAAHAFERRADLVFSRFGVMFFADPAAAFANIRRALKRGGRLAFCCWRDRRENPWVTIPVAAARKHIAELPPPPGPEEPGPFAFADSARIQRILTSAGFTQVSCEKFDPQIMYGDGTRSAAEFLSQMGPVGSVLQEHPEALRAQVVDTLAGMLEPHREAGGVRLGAAVWIVTARNE